MPFSFSLSKLTPDQYEDKQLTFLRSCRALVCQSKHDFTPTSHLIVVGFLHSSWAIFPWENTGQNRSHADPVFFTCLLNTPYFRSFSQTIVTAVNLASFSIRLFPPRGIKATPRGEIFRFLSSISKIPKSMFGEFWTKFDAAPALASQNLPDRMLWPNGIASSISPVSRLNLTVRYCIWFR